MFQLANDTPFGANLGLFPDEEGVDTLYPVLCARFQLLASGRLRLADEQRRPYLADIYYGAPATSSLRYPGEMHLCKSATDVLLLGDAYAGTRSAAELRVGLRVGALARTLTVRGDRRWDPEGTPGRPAPFVRLPLRYERARGGRRDAENPVGIADDERPPNLEDPAAPIERRGDRPSPAGFGPIAPHWSPRADRVGTYDRAWQRGRAPYLPVDFDRRFFQAAPAGQVYPGYLRGGEPIDLRHVFPFIGVRFSVPACDLRVEATVSGATRAIAMNIETLLLEPGEGRVELTWRGALRVDKRLLEVERVEMKLQSLGLGGRA